MLPIQLTNTIPLNLLGLSYNRIGGMLPPEIGKWQKLKWMLHWHELVLGSLPATEAVWLAYYWVWNVSISQIIHSTAHCLARLAFSGSLLRHSYWQIAQNSPVWGLLKWAFDKLESFLWCQCLSAKWHPNRVWKGLTNIISLFLLLSKVSGPFPSELGQMTRLQLLSLFACMLTPAQYHHQHWATWQI